MGKKNKEGRDVIECYDKQKGKCEHHKRKCTIPVSFPNGDSRAKFVAEIKKIGASKHTLDNEHMCDICVRERQEGRRQGYYQIDKIDGKTKSKPILEQLEMEREELRKSIERKLAR